MLQLSRTSGTIPRGGNAARECVLLLLFAASATATVRHSLAMATMGEIPMPGGWSLSMMWLPVCGQSWAGATVAFIVMWAAMMATMMLPSLAPLLVRCPRMTPVAAGYALVWTTAGLGVFAGGAVLAEFGPHWPALMEAMPLVAGMIALLAGLLQFTAWKARHLAGCRTIPTPGTWRCGLRLGMHCLQSCAGLTALLLALGMMDLRVMAVVTAAITLERLAPPSPRIALAIGAAVVMTALWTIAPIAAP